MAQCPIISREEGVPAVLSFMASELPDLGTFMEGHELAQVNLWMSVQPTSTNVHYDAHENLLLVTSGVKRVKLWPPEDSHVLCAEPVWSTSPNHSPHTEDTGGETCRQSAILRAG